MNRGDRGRGRTTATTAGIGLWTMSYQVGDNCRAVAPFWNEGTTKVQADWGDLDLCW